MRGRDLVLRPRGFLHRDGTVHHVLLGLTLLLIMVQPVGTAAGGLYTRLVYGFVLVACLATVYPRRKLFWFGLVLGVPALVAILSPGDSVAGQAGLALGIVTIGYVAVVLLISIYERPVVNASSVSSSLTVYVLLGIVWALAYALVESIWPGSFYGISGETIVEIRRDLFYFSFVTLTTLGYGDVGPSSSWARSLAIAQAIVAQLYLVVLVASLVGAFLHDRVQGRSGGDVSGTDG